MNNFRNNYKRNRFKSSGDRNFRKRNSNGHKINGEFNSSPEFKRKNPGKNNQNAAKLIEKYNDLASEALSNGDKILSENYLQHADHFSRIIISQKSLKAQNLNITQSKNEDNKDKTKEEIFKEEGPNQLNITD